MGPPQHKHKHISMRSTENCCLLGSIPPRYSKTRWNKILYLAAARSHLTYAQTKDEENVLFFFCLCLSFARPHHLCSALRAVFECRKVIGFAFATLHDRLKKFAPIFHPTRSKTKTNRDSLARVFPRFASATCD